jgi:hypothetical protein
MVNRHSQRILVLLLALLAAGGAAAQTPATQPRTGLTALPPPQQAESVALDGLGNVTLLWQQTRTHRPYLRRFSASDVPLGPELRLSRSFTEPRAAANERGDTVITWSQNTGGGEQVLVRLLRAGLPPLTVQANRPGSFSRFTGDVDIDREGRFVAIWMESDSSGIFGVRGQRFNADGSRRGAVFTVSARAFEPRVAMNHLTGEFVVIWQAETFTAPVVATLFGQRFDFTSGRPLGNRIRINETELGEFPDADVGRADDGSFVVLWNRHSPGEPASDDAVADLLVRRFNPDGTPFFSEVLVAADIPLIGNHSRLAVSPEGDFVVTWNSGETPNLRLLLVRRKNFPAIGQPLALPDRSAELAFGWNGTFVLAWERDFGSIQYQRFAAARGQEVCLFGGGHFRCDTDRTGGAPEIDHLFSVRGGTPLLGDVDGDGRDDYCLVRGTRFDCDSGHDYGAAEFTAVFGQPGDTPLLGDLDGDGRDEPCVFRSGHFLCDAAHDGGPAELDIAFGQAGDLALIGDVTRDGFDEPCVARDGKLLCDTARNGGAAELVLSFSRAGTPFLGDLDGNGTEDPCVLSDGFVSCNVSHNGVSEAILEVTGSGVPLMGNVDGL